MDWKTGLKIAGPSGIAAWAFVELIKSYLSTSDIFRTNIYLNFILLTIIFSFCVIMGWLWVRNGSENNKIETTEKKIEKNEICDNEAGNNLSVGSENSSIIDNKISKNKVKGSINIGSK